MTKAQGKKAVGELTGLGVAPLLSRHERSREWCVSIIVAGRGRQFDRPGEVSAFLAATVLPRAEEG